ncbi:hypothetical protein SESBI_38043 [Sesbania bispinosa]|nr:hypothetical protein SESBI_38043 [Sesbania bispinosa]
MLDYEEQRLRRYAKNRAVMEALGLPQMASSLKDLTRNTKNKKKGNEKLKDNDEEYIPEDEEEPELNSLSEQDGYDEDDDLTFEDASRSRKRKVIGKKIHYNFSVG